MTFVGCIGTRVSLPQRLKLRKHKHRKQQQKQQHLHQVGGIILAGFQCIMKHLQKLLRKLHIFCHTWFLCTVRNAFALLLSCLLSSNQILIGFTHDLTFVWFSFVFFPLGFCATMLRVHFSILLSFADFTYVLSLQYSGTAMIYDVDKNPWSFTPFTYFTYVMNLQFWFTALRHDGVKKVHE